MHIDDDDVLEGDIDHILMPGYGYDDAVDLASSFEGAKRVFFGDEEDENPLWQLGLVGRAEIIAARDPAFAAAWQDILALGKKSLRLYKRYPQVAYKNLWNAVEIATYLQLPSLRERLSELISRAQKAHVRLKHARKALNESKNPTMSFGIRSSCLMRAIYRISEDLGIETVLVEEDIEEVLSLQPNLAIEW